MNTILQGQIARVFEAYRDWWNEGPIPPATPQSITAAKAWFADHYPGELPAQLAEFWRTTNGIDLHGKALWAAEAGNDVSGIIDVNALYVDEFGDHFFLGKSDDIWMYAYHPESGKFRILAMFEFDHIEVEYDTFDELASSVLHSALDQAGLL